LKKNAALAIAAIFILAPAIRAQQKAEASAPAKTAAAAPQLKPDVELELVKSQKELYEILLQMKAIEAQYQQIQKQFSDKQIALREKTQTALDRSGIDKTKFDLNPDTLAVTPKAQPGLLHDTGSAAPPAKKEN
jgi:hypothetical protein